MRQARSDSWEPTDPRLAEVFQDPDVPLDGQFSATFVMVSPNGSEIYDVEFLPPDHWRIQVDRDPFSGLVTDGTTHVAVDRGDVLLRIADARPVVSHSLRNMFFPKRTFDWDATTVMDRQRVVRGGRDTWELDVEIPGRPASKLIVDRETGVLVAIRHTSGPGRMELHDFTVAEPDPARFTWEGPTHSRPNGVAYVSRQPADEMTPERVHAHWDLCVGPDWKWVLSVDAPESTDIQELVEWGRARAQAVWVRVDNQHYSASSHQPPGGPYPPWRDR